ncbi:MAG: lamin tail domain-containing protein [bacterium]
MNFFKIAIVVALAVIFNVFLFGKAEAQESPKIFINELMWQGSSASTADEWIELYNDSDELIDLSGFKICDEYKNDEPKSQPCKENALMVEIEDGQIAPRGYFLIANFSSADPRSIIDAPADIVDTGISLSNTNLKISLRDHNNQEIDVAGNGSRPFFYKEIMNLKDPNEKKYNSSIERNNYKGFDELVDDCLGNWKITEIASNLKNSFFNKKTSMEEQIIDIANPEISGQPKITNFAVKDDSYILNNSKRINFIYEVEDTDDDFEKVEITGESGTLNFFKNLNTNERSFVLPKSNSCWSLKFTFFDKRGLFREQLVDLKCFEQNDKIYISEVLSSPKDHDWDKNGTKESSDEWFELYNSSQTDCDLSGWYVLDKSDKKYTFDRSIKKGQFLAFFPSKTKISPKISLNNSGETLYLYDPSGKIVSQVKIPSLAYNISYSFIDGQWYKTSVPTPNAKNVKDEEEDSQVTSSADEKEKTFSSITRTNQSSMGNAESVVIKKVIVRKISYNNASVYLKRKNEALVPKMDGAIVLGASSERRYNPFNPKVFLLYLLAVLLLTSVFTYAFYRRE